MLHVSLRRSPAGNTLRISYERLVDATRSEHPNFFYLDAARLLRRLPAANTLQRYVFSLKRTYFRRHCQHIFPPTYVANIRIFSPNTRIISGATCMSGEPPSTSPVAHDFAAGAWLD